MLVIFLLIFLLDALFYNSLRKGRITGSKQFKKALFWLGILHTSATLFLFIKILLFKGYFEDNSHLTNFLDISFIFSVGHIPKIILTLTASLTRVTQKRFKRLSMAIRLCGRFISLLIIILVLIGSLFGRYNFKVEEVMIEIEDLPDALKGLRLVQVSDMHLSSFHRQGKSLDRAVEIINSLKPDILVNTGDFVSFGYKEMEPFTEALSAAKGKYGSFAILGNHDMGTYHPYWDQNERDTNIVLISELIRKAGYELLRDESRTIEINKSSISIIGVATYGSIPDIFYGDLAKASLGSDTTDLRILLSHDPNHWSYNRDSMKGIELCLSGHTHGMQMGIISGRIRISPARLIFPAWYGLYGSDSSYLYVNRGLGVIGFPFRIGMPPEITVITIN